MKFFVTLIIKKAIVEEQDIEKYYKDITTYIYNIDKLIIMNLTNTPLSVFLSALDKHKNIEVANCTDYGQAQNYQIALNTMKEKGADYGTILELDYFYEEDTYLTMKRFAIENSQATDIALITPMPLFTSEMTKKTSEQNRTIMGARMVGTLVNIQLYRDCPIDTDYYETTFDYDYCIKQRLMKRKIVLFPNMILRNRIFSGVEKKHLFIKTNAYAKGYMELYYETRNRHFLWVKYQKLDPAYVKLDKKMFKKENYEMRICDPDAREKFKMIQRGIDDFRRGITGKYTDEEE